VVGDIYPCWNSDGTKKWPWLTRDIHDWKSSNGVVLNYKAMGFVLFPDEQHLFLDDKMIEDEENMEGEEDWDEREEMEVEADVYEELQMEDKKQSKKVKGKGKAKKG